jgi:hypothetical protein
MERLKIKTLKDVDYLSKILEIEISTVSSPVLLPPHLINDPWGAFWGIESPEGYEEHKEAEDGDVLFYFWNEHEDETKDLRGRVISDVLRLLEKEDFIRVLHEEWKENPDGEEYLDYVEVQVL